MDQQATRRTAFYISSKGHDEINAETGVDESGEWLLHEASLLFPSLSYRGDTPLQEEIWTLQWDECMARDAPEIWGVLGRVLVSATSGRCRLDTFLLG